MVSEVRYSNIVAQTLYQPLRDIRTSDMDHGLKMLEQQIVFGQYCRPDDGCDDPSVRGMITDITASDVRIFTNGVPFRYSRFEGNSTAHMVADVAIQDLSIDGLRVTSLRQLNTTANAFVSNVTVS